MPEDPGRNASRRDSDLAVRRLAMRFTGALRTGDSSSADAVVDEARALGFSTSAVYGRIVEPALITLGELWERGALTVADEHLATAVTHRVAHGRRRARQRKVRRDVSRLDHFKTVNDEQGHPAGDLVLRRAGKALTGAVRPGDLVARDGGDEFVVLLGETPENATLVSERLRAFIADMTPEGLTNGFPLAKPAIWRTGWARLHTLPVPAISRAHPVVVAELNDINARGAIVGNVYGLAAEAFSELRRIHPVLWTCPFGR